MTQAAFLREQRASPIYSTSFDAGRSRASRAMKDASGGVTSQAMRMAYQRCDDAAMRSGFLAVLEVTLARIKPRQLHDMRIRDINERFRNDVCGREAFDEGRAYFDGVHDEIRGDREFTARLETSLELVEAMGAIKGTATAMVDGWFFALTMAVNNGSSTRWG